MAKFTPLHDRILIRRVEEAETSRGGIIIPDTAKDKPQEGEVVSVGKGKINGTVRLWVDGAPDKPVSHVVGSYVKMAT